MPKVSVIIPAYNHAAYIREAIDSVLAQTYKDLEVIVMDDGSTDNTKEVLADYIKDNKIRYFYQNNRGLSAARNAGLKVATGQYVKFLDSDDFLFPLQIEKHMEDVLRVNDIHMLSMTNFSMVGPSGRTQDVIVPMVEKEQLAHFIESNRGAIHSFLFAKTIVEQAGGFDEQLKACEDFDLKLRLLMRGAYVKQIDYIGCCYRLVHTSMSNDTLHMFLQKCMVYEKVNEALFSSSMKFSQYLIDRILRKNSMLIYECIARKLNVGKILSKTASLTMKLYDSEKSGVIRFLYKCLGLENYSLLRYFHKSFTEKGYKDQILTQEISWKIS